MRRAVVLALLLAGARAAWPDTFVDALGSRPLTRPLGEALADAVGRALPVTAASAGVSFTFDPATSAFERSLDLTGQAFLERPQPLGRGRWNVRLVHAWVRLDTIDGQDLDDLSDTRVPIRLGAGPLFVVPRFALEVESQVVTAEVTYGVTEHLDVDVAVPVVDTRFALDAAVRNPRRGGVRFQRAERLRREATGVGDVVVRAKQRLVRRRDVDLSAGLGLRLPSGEEEDFQGTGTWELAPMLHAGGPALGVRRVRLRPYVNGGVVLLLDDVDASEARLGAGVDATLGARVTGGLAVLGREPFAARAAPGFFDVPRFTAARGPRPPAPFLGLDRDRAGAWDLSLGVRVVLWRDTVFGFVHVLLPLTRAGVRADVIPVTGIEAAF